MPGGNGGEAWLLWVRERSDFVLVRLNSSAQLGMAPNASCRVAKRGAPGAVSIVREGVWSPQSSRSWNAAPVVAVDS